MIGGCEVEHALFDLRRRTNGDGRKRNLINVRGLFSKRDQHWELIPFLPGGQNQMAAYDERHQTRYGPPDSRRNFNQTMNAWRPAGFAHLSDQWRRFSPR